MHTQYYEAIIQLRNTSDELEEYVQKQITTSRKAFISKAKKQKNGMDIYISSNSFALALGKWLRENFAGVMKTSRKLYGKSRKTGKIVYRATVLFEFLKIKEGDVVKANNEIIRITGCGRQLTGRNLLTGKKTIINYKKEKPELLEIKEAIVTKTEPHLEVLHPETYESKAVENQSRIKEKKAKVVIVEDKIFLISK